MDQAAENFDPTLFAGIGALDQLPRTGYAMEMEEFNPNNMSLFEAEYRQNPMQRLRHLITSSVGRAEPTKAKYTTFTNLPSQTGPYEVSDAFTEYMRKIYEISPDTDFNKFVQTTDTASAKRKWRVVFLPSNNRVLIIDKEGQPLWYGEANRYIHNILEMGDRWELYPELFMAAKSQSGTVLSPRVDLVLNASGEDEFLKFARKNNLEETDWVTTASSTTPFVSDLLTRGFGRTMTSEGLGLGKEFARGEFRLPKGVDATEYWSNIDPYAGSSRLESLVAYLRKNSGTKSIMKEVMESIILPISRGDVMLSRSRRMKEPIGKLLGIFNRFLKNRSNWIDDEETRKNWLQTLGKVEYRIHQNSLGNTLYDPNLTKWEFPEVKDWRKMTIEDREYGKEKFGEWTDRAKEGIAGFSKTELMKLAPTEYMKLIDSANKLFEKKGIYKFSKEQLTNPNTLVGPDYVWSKEKQMWEYWPEKVRKIVGSKPQKAYFTSEKKHENALRVLGTQLTEEEASEYIPTMVRSIVQADKHFGLAGFGPVSKNSAGLYAGRYLDPSTNRIRTAPAPETKTVNPFSWSSVYAAAQLALLNKWNSYVRAEERIFTLLKYLKEGTWGKHSLELAKRIKTPVNKRLEKKWMAMLNTYIKTGKIPYKLTQDQWRVVINQTSVPSIIDRLQDFSIENFRAEANEMAAAEIAQKKQISNLESMAAGSLVTSNVVDNKVKQLSRASQNPAEVINLENEATGRETAELIPLMNSISQQKEELLKKIKAQKAIKEKSLQPAEAELMEQSLPVAQVVPPQGFGYDALVESENLRINRREDELREVRNELDMEKKRIIESMRQFGKTKWPLVQLWNATFDEGTIERLESGKQYTPEVLHEQVSGWINSTVPTSLAGTVKAAWSKALRG